MEQEERYGIVSNFRHDQDDEVLARLEQLLALDDMVADARQRRDRMVAECVDVTQWMVDFVEGGG